MLKQETFTTKTLNMNLNTSKLPLSRIPRRYPWRAISQVKNDFFQYATVDCLAVGGLGHFAIHVDRCV